MLKLFQKLTKSLSIKNIVILGVVIMTLIIVTFAITMGYLSSTIKYDQNTLKSILDLEKQNQNILTIVRKINFIDNKIILSESLEEIENLEKELVPKENIVLETNRNNHLNRYNIQIDLISKDLSNLVNLQGYIYDSKYVLLFYNKELQSYKSQMNKKIKTISDNTEGLYGKASLFGKRYIRKNKKDLNFEKINDFESVMTISRDLDNSILKLSNFLSVFYLVNQRDIIEDLKNNKIKQILNKFENSLLRMNKYERFDKRLVENINEINIDFYNIRDLLGLYISAKDRFLVEKSKFLNLLKQSEELNTKVVKEIKKLNVISNDIKLDILSHSDYISKTTTLVIVIVGIVSLALLSLAAATLIYRINYPLEFIIKYIERIKGNRKNLNKKLPVITNDEFGKLSNSFNSMTKTIKNNISQIENLNKEIEDTQKEVIFTMGAIGESRSKETGNHVKRVAEYSKILALKYGLEPEIAELLKEASPMHDIGKVGIPDAILKKPARLDSKEWEIMKTHAQLGYEMLKHSKREILKAAAIVAKEHHEKWDGSGYPDGLSGESIHIFGRITAVADVFDALGSDRCYKKAWPLEDILKLFKENRAKHFDPRLVDIFFDNIDEFLEVRDKFKD